MYESNLLRRLNQIKINNEVEQAKIYVTGSNIYTIVVQIVLLH